MNYIQVAEVATTVEKAQQLGAKVEVANEAFYGGHIALIRDPMGAGFTVYDGDQLRQSRQPAHGVVLGRELQVSNAAKVIDFYSGLLGWQFVEGAYPEQLEGYTSEGTKVAAVQELDNAVKGKYEYWVTVFGVRDMALAHDKIVANGGQLISDERYRMLFADHYGEAFFYIKAV